MAHYSSAWQRWKKCAAARTRSLEGTVVSGVLFSVRYCILLWLMETKGNVRTQTVKYLNSTQIATYFFQTSAVFSYSIKHFQTETSAKFSHKKRIIYSNLTLRTLLTVLAGGSSLTAVIWTYTVHGALCFRRSVSFAVIVKWSSNVSVLSWT